MATGCTSTLMSKNEGGKYFVYYNFIYVIWTTTAVHTQHNIISVRAHMCVHACILLRQRETKLDIDSINN